MGENDRGYASPPCYAHEVDPSYMGLDVLQGPELVALLNTLLEAERAGAKVLAAYLDDYEVRTPAWEKLRKVQRDEARNCAILTDLVKRLNGTPSNETGDFYHKALAMEGHAQRLMFLNRGQDWVARQLKKALPKIADSCMRKALTEMHESHVQNIEACDALIR